MIKEYTITPVAKPRMTQSDKWNKRPACMKYWAFRDECRGKALEIPDKSRVCFIIPFPKSWSQAKREEMYYQPHTQKPDIDNLIKAVLDAVYDDDSTISEIHAKKIWGNVGMIIVRPIE